MPAMLGASSAGAPGWATGGGVGSELGGAMFPSRDVCGAGRTGTGIAAAWVGKSRSPHWLQKRAVS